MSSKNKTKKSGRKINMYFSHRIQSIGIEGLSEIRNLQSQVKTLLDESNLRVKLMSPEDYEIIGSTHAAIIRHDLRLVEDCDVFFVDLSHGIGAGSMMELFHAKHDCDKLCIGYLGHTDVTQDNAPQYTDASDKLSLWVHAHLDFLLDESMMTSLPRIVSENIR